MSRIGLTAPQPVEAMNEEKVRFALRTQLLYSCLDSVNLCQFVFGPAWQLYGPDELVQAVQQITGWNVTLEADAGGRAPAQPAARLQRARRHRPGAGYLAEKLQQALIGRPGRHSVPLEEFERAKIGITSRSAGIKDRNAHARNAGGAAAGLDSRRTRPGVTGQPPDMGSTRTRRAPAGSGVARPSRLCTSRSPRRVRASRSIPASANSSSRKPGNWRSARPKRRRRCARNLDATGAARMAAERLWDDNLGHQLPRYTGSSYCLNTDYRIRRRLAILQTAGKIRAPGVRRPYPVA